MDRGALDQLGMKSRSDDCALFNQNWIVIMPGEYVDALADLCNLRRADKNRLDALDAGDAGRYKGPKAVDLPTVGVPFYRDIQESYAGLFTAFDFRCEKDQPCAGAKDRRSVFNLRDKRVEETETDQKAPYDSAFSARKNECLRFFYIIGRSDFKPLASCPRQRSPVGGIVPLQGEDSDFPHYYYQPRFAMR
jgi:hypothetical protein